MTNTALVQIKVDTETKTNVTSIYESLGLDLPTAVRIFFKKSIAVGGLPFELRDDTRSKRWDIYKTARNSIQKNTMFLKCRLMKSMLKSPPQGLVNNGKKICRY